MRNLKKILALVLALMMVLSVMVTASAAEYADAADIKYTQAVEVMSELSILQGDGTNFNPKGELNRAEAAVILTKILLSGNLKALAQQADAIANPFTDVADSHWGLDYIKFCYNEGLIIGNGKGNFYPGQKLTGYAFAKTLLIAAGIGDSDDYLTDKTGTWESKVLAAANKNRLLTGLSTIKLSKNITREEAAQMALNAMKAGATTTVVYEITTPSGVVFETTDALVAATWDANTEAVVVTYEVNYGGLLFENFDVYCHSGSDEFGRPSTVYTYDYSYAYAGLDYDVYYPSAPVATYTTSTQATKVLADLGGYYIADTSSDTYVVADDTVSTWNVAVVDGTTSTTLGTGVSFAQIAGLTGLNKVVEVYANVYGYINKIVVVETKFGTVSTITPADKLYGYPETFTMSDGSGNVNTAGLQKNVPYTWNVTTANKTVNVTPAVGFEGVMTAYNNYGSIVVNGTTYYVDDASVLAAAVAKFNQKAIYYLGANGSIIYVGEPASVVVGNYAQVIGAAVKSDSNLWGTASTATVQVKAILSDGTYGVYNIPTSTAIDGTLYVTVNGLRKAVDSFSFTEGNLSDDLNGVYTYTLEGNNISLGNNFAANVVSTTNHGEIAQGALTVTVDDTITAMINSDTVFVLKTSTPNKYTTVKGSAGIAGIAADEAVVIYKAVLNATRDGYNYVVTHVIAKDDVAASAGVSNYDLNNYVYVSPYYTTTTDVAVGTYYSYVAYKVDGTLETVISAVELDAGVYTYNPATKLPVGLVDMDAWGYVTAVAGTTYEIYDAFDLATEYYTITDSATVLVVAPGGALKAGAGVGVEDINADGIIDLVVITIAAAE